MLYIYRSSITRDKNNFQKEYVRRCIRHGNGDFVHYRRWSDRRIGWKMEGKAHKSEQRLKQARERETYGT